MRTSQIKSFLISLIVLLFCTANLKAQTPKIDIEQKNVTLEKFFKEIQKKTGYTVMYNNIDLKMNVSVNAKNEELSQVLAKALSQHNISFEIVDKRIILNPQTQPRKPKKEIKGTVTDDLGDPIIGASVMLIGTNNGTITDIDGKYTLNDVSEGQSIEVSYITYDSQTIKVGPESVINFQLKENEQLLNEVVVVGYGTMEKRQVTSSISSIKGDALPKGVGGSSIETVLRGKVSGMTIAGTSSPNSENSIQLRGIASVNASKGPLVVIDGIPGGDLRSLNQEDIESIDVLKDASAGAIYGTRAAGGVILVTTKQAKEGPIKITYTGELSMETVRRKPEILSAEEFVERKLGDDYGARENWYDAVLRDNPISNRHVINMSGGGKNARIYATFMAQDQKGISLGDSRTDYSARMNATFSALDGLLDIKTHAEYRKAKRDKRHSNGMYRMAMRMNPTIPIYDDEDPSGYNVDNYFGSDAFNPVADVNLRSRGGTDTWLLGDVTAKLNITSDLSATATLGYQEKQWQYNNYVSAWHNESTRGGRRGAANLGYDKTYDKSIETYASYNKTIKDHTMNIVAGFSFFQTDNFKFSMTNYDFPVDGIGPWDIGSGSYLKAGKAEMSSERKPRERLVSVFGRANYGFKDKYMATLSIRHEGSSKFGKNHRWGTFWAISGGWIISKEDFMKNVDFINNLKIRLGYGVTGNNNFTPGKTVRMYKSDGWFTNDDKWGMVYGSKHNVNPDLKWEEKAELNFGIDYSFFNDRLFGKFDIYERKVSDMLYDVSVAQPPSVHDKTLKNIGNLKNTGWELEIGGVPVRNKNFSYTTSVRLSQNKTKIESIGNVSYIDVSDGGFPSPGNPGNPFRLEDGLELGQYYMKKHAGIDENGQFLVYDKDGEIIEATKSGNDDKRFLGNAIPKLYLSWDHTLTYRNWDLSIYLRSHLNFDVFNMADMYYGLPPKTTGENVLRKAFSPERENIKGEKELSDFWLEDGSFLKLDAVVLGYTLNLKKYNKYLESVRLYLNARDLFCITGYSGQDPEVDVNGLLPGVEWINKDSLYPKTRRFTLGIQLQF